jgi:YfaZ precursor
VIHPLSENVALVGYADVGSGGADLTYQFIGGVNWELSKGLTVKEGYRHLSWDFEEDGTVWDMVASGPYLGFGIRF